MDTPPPIISNSPSGPTVQQWKVILHLCGFAVLVIPLAGNIVVPLIIWLIKKPASPELDAEGRKVLNFQISYTIYFLAAVAVSHGLFFLILPLVLPPLVAIAWIVLTIFGAVRVSNGVDYQFPFVIRML